MYAQISHGYTWYHKKMITTLSKNIRRKIVEKNDGLVDRNICMQTFSLPIYLFYNMFK